MDVDASFAEYVAARWSMLYRLSVLLAGEPDADDLAQAALVRAYLSWPEVQEGASTDDEVKRILATTAVHHWGPGRGEDLVVEEPPLTGSPERDRLWAGISALPRRQRVVLVLRHYEGLSDRDIAAAVRSPTSAVTAEAGTLEAGIDLAALREELVDRAEGVVLPLPPIADLVAQGHEARRQRTRRRSSRLGVAAGVVVVGVALAAVLEGDGSSGRRQPTRPEPTPTDVPSLSALPRGATPSVAYSVRQFLYLPGGRGVDLGGRPAAIVQTPEWVHVAYLSGEIMRVSTTAPAVETVAETSGGQLVTDPAGNRLAWLDSAVGGARVRLGATDETDPVEARRPQYFPARLRCCDDPFEVNGITADGELIASLPAENRVWAWDTRDPDAGVRELAGVGNGVVSQVTAGGFVVHYPPAHYALGQVEGDAFLQVAEIAAVAADFSDPEGHRIVYADGNGEIHVREMPARGESRRAGPDIRLRLPPLDGFADASWEDSEHVLLDVYDESAPHGALVRCDVGDGACELADELEGPHLLAH